MAYWLVKSEPSEYSIDHLKRDKRTLWHGVRNYQARNYLREMAKGEQVLFYHSNADPTGIAGLATVMATALPDPTQFERAGDYFDPKATLENPRWFCPELAFSKKFSRIVALDELRKQKALAQMVLLRRGSRLSVQPVTDRQFECILHLLD